MKKGFGLAEPLFPLNRSRTVTLTDQKFRRNASWT